MFEVSDTAGSNSLIFEVVSLLDEDLVARGFVDVTLSTPDICCVLVDSGLQEAGKV